MVKVNAPAMSLDASGQLGKSMVFSKWKGRNYVRSLVTPSNPQSAPQTSVRAMMRFLSQYWASQTTGDKATWLALAAMTSISPFNAYVSENLTRWSHFKGPSKAYPAADASAAASAPTTTITAGVRELQLSIADGATPPSWGWMVFRSTTTGFTPSFSNLIHVLPRTATPTVWIDKPLTSGVTYYYRIKGFNSDAKLGALEAEKSGTPT